MINLSPEQIEELMENFSADLRPVVKAVLSSPILSAYIDKQVKEAREQAIKDVEAVLDPCDNELGFVEISNHIPFSSWQSLKGQDK